VEKMAQFCPKVAQNGAFFAKQGFLPKTILMNEIGNFIQKWLKSLNNFVIFFQKISPNSFVPKSAQNKTKLAPMAKFCQVWSPCDTK
jgi:hypothetical protein